MTYTNIDWTQLRQTGIQGYDMITDMTNPLKKKIRIQIQGEHG